jgi:hypothetical protein
MDTDAYPLAPGVPLFSWKVFDTAAPSAVVGGTLTWNSFTSVLDAAVLGQLT